MASIKTIYGEMPVSGGQSIPGITSININSGYVSKPVVPTAKHSTAGVATAPTRTLSVNEQAQLLNAYNRVKSGVGQSADQANIDYAIKNGLWKPPVEINAPKTIAIPEIPSVMTETESRSTSPVTPTQPPEVDYGSSFLNALVSGNNQTAVDYLKNYNQPLPEQKEVSTIQTRIQELLGLSGKRGEKQAELQTELGVTEQTKKLADVNAQIASKTAEFQSLMEQNANRPISTRIIGGAQDRLARQAGIELGSLTSLSQALQGNIQTAKQTAADTIEFEFAPIEAELDAQLQQLANSYNSLTRAEKKRADELIIVLNERINNINSRKTEKNNVAQLMAQVAQVGGGADVLREIMASGSLEEAIILAQPFLQMAGTGEILSPTEAAALNVPYGTTKEQAFGVTPKSQLNTQDKIALEVKLSNQFSNYSKEAREAKRQIGLMEESYTKAQEAMKEGKSINAASQGVLVTFQKLLDPTSVVRESEYSRSPEGLSLLGKIEGKYTQLKQGGAGLTANDLTEFINLGREFLANYEESQMNYIGLIKNQANSYGLDITNILPPDALGLLNQSMDSNQGEWGW